MITINPQFEELIPPLTSDELSGLKESIHKEGMHDSLKVWKETGQILDGHNRYRIAQELKLDYQVEELSFESETDARILIIDCQLGRRNLNDMQRIELAERKNEYLKPLAKERMKKGKPSVNNDKGSVRDQIAKDAGVSTGKVAQKQYIEKEGTEEQIEQMKSGKKKIGTVYNEIKKEKKRKEEENKPFDRVPMIKCELVFEKGGKPKNVPSSDKNARITLGHIEYPCEFICIHNTSKLIER